jgi:lauroyl/myristoyl acyltransferase
MARYLGPRLRIVRRIGKLRGFTRKKPTHRKCTNRGYYEVRFKKIADACLHLSDEDIMKYYVDLLEKQIIEKPEYWLWSHKRWKRKRI